MRTKVKSVLRVAGPAFLSISLLVVPLAFADTQGGTQGNHILDDDVADTPREIETLRRQQHGGVGGHLPGSSQNVELVGKVRVHDAEPGRISDVAGFGNFAYLGAFDDGDCTNGGVYVIDISDPSRPNEVGFIRAAVGSYVGEGVQVLHVDTPSFNGDLLVHNNEICNETHGVGGISLVDVTNPQRPVILAEGVGDFTDDGVTSAVASQVHSAFAWDAGDRAYVILVDDEEALDVDIMEITDPRNPVLLKETGLPDWGAAQNAQSGGTGAFAASFFHDLQVRQFGAQWLALLSYWDAGWVILDVTDPINPVFLDDTDYFPVDPVTGFRPAEGNAHQAWWSADGKFFIGTDEDFDAFRVSTEITSGPFRRETFNATQGSNVPQITDEISLVGPTVFVGRACNAHGPGAVPVPPAPSPDAIAIVERGVCTFTEKAGNVSAAGYVGGIVFNSETGDPPCEALVSMLVAGDIPFLFVARSTGFKILGIAGYDPANCPGGSNPALPAVGTAGSDLSITAQFDGLGYAHLFDAETLREVDTFTIPETFARPFAIGFGDLSVHEVETDDTQNLAYFSWYAGGFRVARFGRDGIEEVGHYIDANGNNFWGIDPHVDPRDGSTIILASDRDSGLWIFKYTGP